MAKKTDSAVPERPNYAGMHKQEIRAAIENAPDVATLDEIDADLQRTGWSAQGRMRLRIATLKSQPDSLPAVRRDSPKPDED